MRKRGNTRFARSLRRRSTEAERRLWVQLRNRTLLGAKFRRQHCIGPYVVDFMCIEARLIVELDGSQHLESTHDAMRDAALKREGFRLLRFWNNQVMASMDDVLEHVADALARPNPCTPRNRKEQQQDVPT